MLNITAIWQMRCKAIIALIAAFAVIFAGALVARQAVRGSPKFTWIREKAVFWAATGGTSFYGVDLTDACFDGASLPHTDFRKAILTRASFEGATGLDLARLQGTILEPPKVRKLLINKGDRLILSEPKPDSGEFKPGEFEKWIGELQKTVDLIFREGLNWRAFMFSLAQTAIEHEGTYS